MKQLLAFLIYAVSLLLAISITFIQSNLFWDCANGFLNSFSVHNDFNTTNNFIKFLKFTYNFVENNVMVIYEGNFNFSKLMIKSKPRSNGSNKNGILKFLIWQVYSLICR